MAIGRRRHGRPRNFANKKSLPLTSSELCRLYIDYVAALSRTSLLPFLATYSSFPMMRTLDVNFSFSAA